MTPPSEQATAALAENARARSEDARQRISRALNALRRSGKPISIKTVAERAGVSRKTIYQHADLREQIRAHANTRPPTPEPAATDNSIISALRAQLTATEFEVKKLKDEVKEEDSLIATLYGQLDSARD